MTQLEYKSLWFYINNKTLNTYTPHFSEISLSTGIKYATCNHTQNEFVWQVSEATDAPMFVFVC